MKITIIGAGNVGSTCAEILAYKNIVNEIILLDIKKNLAEGKALDINQRSMIFKSDTKIIGVTNNYKLTHLSDIIVITSGIIRKSGMTRDDVLILNANIVKSVIIELIKFSPHAKFIIVSNPLDIMTYIAYKTLKIPSNHIFGMSGLLDLARYCFFISKKIKCSITNIQGMLIGSHNDDMIPLPRYTSIAGIPVNEMLNEDIINDIILNTKKSGANIINYLGISAWYTPGACIAEMIEIMIKDLKKIIPCCTYLKGQYNINNICIGVPVILGKNGIEKIIELKLNTKETQLLNNAVINIKKMIVKLQNINLL